jgi:hypothetical protein
MGLAFWSAAADIRVWIASAHQGPRALTDWPIEALLFMSTAALALIGLAGLMAWLLRRR